MLEQKCPDLIVLTSCSKMNQKELEDPRGAAQARLAAQVPINRTAVSAQSGKIS
jgi:hypothetical protein